jgi:hypothetical protein
LPKTDQRHQNQFGPKVIGGSRRHLPRDDVLGRRPARYSHLNDNEQTSNYAMDLCLSDEECEAWMKLLFIRARNQLGNFWPAVEALAEELLKRDTITYAEARQIICDAMRPPGSLPEIETIP